MELYFYFKKITTRKKQKNFIKTFDKWNFIKNWVLQFDLFGVTI